LLKKDRAEAAESHFRRAIAIDPGHAQAHSNLGITLKNRNALAEAEQCLKRALVLDPSCEGALENLIKLLIKLNKHDEVEGCLRRVIAAGPTNAAAHNTLGVALCKQGKLDQAAASFERAVAIDPGYIEAYHNLGLTLKNAGNLDAAAAAHRRAIEVEPACATAHLALGNVLTKLNQPVAAVESFRRTVEIEPECETAHWALGDLLLKLGQTGAAADSLRRAIEIKPDFPVAYFALGCCSTNQGNFEEAAANFRRAVTLKPDFVEAHSSLIFTLNYSAQATTQKIFSESRRWGEVHAAPLAARARPHANDPDPGRRLRVGYVSPDFREHSVSYFLEPLLAAHDRRAVEVICYAEVAEPDHTTARVRELADGWCSTIGMTNTEVADRIRHDGIDILIDLAGHTAHNRLLAFAERPAPVQVTWLGYGETTGMTAMDYRLSDSVVEPKDAEQFSTEAVVRLPHGFLCYEPNREAPDVVTPPVTTNGHITFGSFNSLVKVTPKVVETWARILHAVPGSRLFLKGSTLRDDGIAARYRAQFASHGIEESRIELLGVTPSICDHLDAYGRMDLALDPFPYNGCTTTCEALWMGVPVVTLRGDRVVARMGASILARVGLTDLVAETSEAYIEKAVALANDLDRLTALRSGLRGRMRASPLCDAQGFARDMEAAYRDMWRRWCNAEAGHD
jgi:predicted O-linked N-acetylglucosamine transferase (SPINDLY family)